jgi:hypothetical protein
VREPKAFVDSAVWLRRALYELQRAPGASSKGSTAPEILNYVSAKKWPSISRDFDQAMQRLIDLKKAATDGPKSRRSEEHFWLTHDGLVEEETIGQPGRRSLVLKVCDELRRPTRIAGGVYAVVGVVIGYLLRAFFSGP